MEIILRIKAKLQEKKGGMEILIVILLLISMVFISVIFEYLRVQIYAGNIRDSFERAILTVASENYNEVFAGFREYQIIGGEYEGGSEGGGDKNEAAVWIPFNDEGNVYAELLELLNMEEGADNQLTGKYELSDIEVYVMNAQASESGKYEIKGSIKVKLPIFYLGVIEREAEFTLQVRTAYSVKY